MADTCGVYSRLCEWVSPICKTPNNWTPPTEPTPVYIYIYIYPIDVHVRTYVRHSRISYQDYRYDDGYLGWDNDSAGSVQQDFTLLNNYVSVWSKTRIFFFLYTYIYAHVYSGVSFFFSYLLLRTYIRDIIRVPYFNTVTMYPVTNIVISNIELQKQKKSAP